jgi:hypothetical protein
MAEDLSEEDIVGDILGFELVAAEGAVGAAEVSWFPREVEGAEGGGNVLGRQWGTIISDGAVTSDADSRNRLSQSRQTHAEPQVILGIQ